MPSRAWVSVKFRCDAHLEAGIGTGVSTDSLSHRERAKRRMHATHLVQQDGQPTAGISSESPPAEGDLSLVSVS